MTAREVTEAVALYGAGWGTPALGRRYGVRANTIRYHLLRRGVRMRRAGVRGFGRLIPRTRIRELLCSGLSLRETAEACGASLSTVRRVCDRLGLPRPRRRDTGRRVTETGRAARRLLREGLSAREVVERTGISASYVRHLRLVLQRAAADLSQDQREAA